MSDHRRPWEVRGPCQYGSSLDNLADWYDRVQDRREEDEEEELRITNDEWVDELRMTNTEE